MDSKTAKRLASERRARFGRRRCSTNYCDGWLFARVKVNGVDLPFCRECLTREANLPAFEAGVGDCTECGAEHVPVVPYIGGERPEGEGLACPLCCEERGIC